MPGMHHGAHMMEPIEWEDTMAAHNRMTTPENMFWKLVDRETGKANHDIEWTFTAGDRVKIRIINEPHSDHPMQHPIHFHGQRFLILSRDSVPGKNLMWKDTVLIPAGQTVDILLDASNPGAWMAHCHIAEHLESHMMFNFFVQQKGTKPEVHHHHHHE
jgi:FtsP/CotA-like multicopper oxidase with cupredoxin domain